MTKTKEIIVKVKWHGPFSVEEITNGKTPLAFESGLYQIYGLHVVFGPDSLLYIGRTGGKTHGPTFKSRIKKHDSIWLMNFKPVSIYLGTIGKNNQATNDPLMNIKLVEDFSIWWHSPPCNSQNINSFKARKLNIPLRVINLGERGKLIREYSEPR